MANRFSFRKLLSRLYGASAPASVAAEVFPETNRIVGKTIRAGAFEFLASTPLGEVRGRLADPDREPQEGVPVFIHIPSKCIRLDTTPPDENVFAGRVTGCVKVAGFFEVRFETHDGIALCILAAEAPPECEPDESLYAWVFPEDVVGFPG